ncbi:SapC family protein [Sphingomonas sp. NPDC079357]|uniref:SapC family protein n=1 Tax=Sphingomonas sp. NPDC079357 TaxID=3364518 RepID=UPI00384E87AA
MTDNLPLEGTQFLYSRPEALHSAVHADLRYRPEGASFDHAAEVHLVPLLVGEFMQAMAHYPVIFAGPEKTPLAVMGLAEKQNLFVQDGSFEPGCYVPAYLRRYPFTLAGAGDEQFVVCVDRDAKGFVSEGEGQALFEDGEPTGFTKNAISFLEEFERERKRTQEFVDLLTDADLFEVKNTLFVRGGEREHIADYYGVDEKKLMELGDEAMLRLVRSGALIAVYAHLFSLARWDGLIARRDAQTAAQPAEELASAD